MANIFCRIIMNKNIFKTLMVLLLTLTICFLGIVAPNSSTATKYNYIANGEKDILGFKVSGIVQKDDCDTIEINLSSNKNVVEFSTYQDVVYNGTTYQSGNHTVEKSKNVTFQYTISEGNSLSPIIIYLERIENTSCPLEIRYCSDGVIIEKVNLTLSATFYSDQASDLRENKENSSGSLVQEDVIISRPNIPAEKEEPSKPENNPSEETTKPTTPNENQGNNNQGNNNQGNNNQEETTPPTESTQPSTPSEEIELPIIDEDATTIPPTDETTPPTEENVPPVDDTPKPDNPPEPPSDDENNGGILGFINNIDRTILIIAIAVVGLLLVIVVVLIIVLSTRKKKVPVEQPEQPIPVQPEAPVFMPPVEEQQQFIPQPPIETIPVEPINNDFVIDDDSLSNDIPVEIQPQEETVEPETSENVAPVIEEPITENVIEEPIVVVDKYEQLLLASIPEIELNALKSEFINSDDNGDEYSNIVL